MRTFHLYIICSQTQGIGCAVHEGYSRWRVKSLSERSKNAPTCPPGDTKLAGDRQMTSRASHSSSCRVQCRVQLMFYIPGYRKEPYTDV